jgi:two-component system, NtrC family, sensor kinase
VALQQTRPFTPPKLNIVKNAGEAMSNVGRLSVSSVRLGENVVITIADTGPGTPEHVLPTIFEPFKTYGKAGRTGLGMAIAKSAIDADEGRIDVESRLGRSTTFTITVPSKPAV